MKKESVIIEAFMQNCLNAHKKIVIPYNEKESKKHIALIKGLLAKGLITQKTYDKSYKETMSSTLDNKTYKQYLECVKFLKTDDQTVNENKP